VRFPYLTRFIDDDGTAVLITRGLYWDMLEAGIALIACCLPTLSALIRIARNPSLQNRYDNITTASAGTVELKDINRSDRPKPGSHARYERDASLLSQTAAILGHPDAARVETYVNGDVSKIALERDCTALGNIWVDSTIEQSSNRVWIWSIKVIIIGTSAMIECSYLAMTNDIGLLRIWDELRDLW